MRISENTQLSVSNNFPRLIARLARLKSRNELEKQRAAAVEISTPLPDRA